MTQAGFTKNKMAIVKDWTGKELLKCLHEVFLQDPAIDEAGFIYDEVPASSLSPFFLNEHKLGIPMQYVTILYKEAQLLFLNRNVRHCHGTSENDAGLVVHDVSGLQQMDTVCSCSDSMNDDVYDIQGIINVTRSLLLINHRYTTAWNERKLLVKFKKLSLSQELKFTSLVLSIHPKTDVGWAHRSWLLKMAIGSDISDEILLSELALCQSIARLYSRNYHNWTYRQLVIDISKRLNVNNSIIYSDLELTEAWIQRNISDHCALFHKEYLLSLLCQCTPICNISECPEECPLTFEDLQKDVRHTLTSKPLSGVLSGSLVDKSHDHCISCYAMYTAIVSVAHLIDKYPCHDSLWAHLQRLFSRFLQQLKQHPVLYAFHRQYLQSIMLKLEAFKQGEQRRFYLDFVFFLACQVQLCILYLGYCILYGVSVTFVSFPIISLYIYVCALILKVLVKHCCVCNYLITCNIITG